MSSRLLSSRTLDGYCIILSQLRVLRWHPDNTVREELDAVNDQLNGPNRALTAILWPAFPEIGSVPILGLSPSPFHP